MLNLCARHGIGLVMEMFLMSRINKALDRLREAKVCYRAVLTNDFPISVGKGVSFGEAVHCSLAKPMHSACMVLGIYAAQSAPTVRCKAR